MHQLQGTGGWTPEPELRGLVAEDVLLCRENAREGYVGASYENLGLATRSFHPQLVPAVDRILRQTAPEVLGYYWHGVGRSVFFDPVNLLPGSDGLLFEMAAGMAPDEAARLSAVAGAAWGFVVVNPRDPPVPA